MLTNFKVVAFLTALSAIGAGCILVDPDDDGIDDTDDGGGSGDGGFVSDGGFGAGTDNSNGGSGAGTVCADDFSGTPADCFVESCEDLPTCGGIDNFKDGVAEILVDCINALNPASCSFEFEVLDVCTIDALSAACFDDTSETYCNDIAGACGETNDEEFQNTCGAFIDGLSSTGKDVFTNCQVDACVNGGGLDLYLCLYDLYP